VSDQAGTSIDTSINALLLTWRSVLWNDTKVSNFSIQEICDLVSPPVPIAIGRIILEEFRDYDLVECNEQAGLYSLTADGLRKADKQYRLVSDLSRELIPASDRIVSREDNQEFWDQIDCDLEALSKEIGQSNESGKTLGDRRMVFTAEIEASRKLISSDMFDAGKLIYLLIPTLRYLVDKFADGAIAALAYKLIEELMKWVG
jgi:hypothetical protein